MQHQQPLGEIQIDEALVKSFAERKSCSSLLPPELRRLDSLAYLLELEGICAAVCLINNQILITVNNIHAPANNTLPRNKQVVLTKEILTYFNNRKFGNSEEEIKSAIDLLLKICQAKIKAINRDSIPTLDTALLKRIIEELYYDNTGREWMKQARELPDFYPSFLPELSNVDISSWGEKEEEKTADIKKTFLQCWYLVFAFRKCQSYFEEHREIEDCKILAVGEKDEHAELRMLGYLFEAEDGIKFENNNTQTHIGLSKLCCAECRAAIYACEQALEAEAKKQFFSVTGHHGLDIGGTTPRYLKGECYFKEGTFPKIYSIKSGQWSDIPQKPWEEKVELQYKQFVKAHTATMEILRLALLTKGKKTYSSMNKTPSPSPAPGRRVKRRISVAQSEDRTIISQDESRGIRKALFGIDVGIELTLFPGSPSKPLQSSSTSADQKEQTRPSTPKRRKISQP